MGARHHLSRGVADISTRSLVCGLVLFGVLTGALLAPGLAAADPAPLWSDPVTTTSWAAYGAGGREVMYVNALQLGTLDTERVIGPDGAIEYQAETENTTIASPALAVDGSGYVLRGGGAAGVIDAIDTAGKVRWSYVVPAENTVRALLAGNDGAAYVVVSNAIDEEVLRLSAVDGSVTFDTPLPYGNYSDGFLFAEPAGVAAITGTHILFLSQQGQITADVAAIPSGSATWFTSNTAGDVFVGTASAGGGQVNTAGGIAVSKVDPTGQVDWTTQTPANNGGGQSTGLAALPDGGVAYEVAGQSVGVLNPDGTSRWSTEDPHGYGPMLADSADYIDFERFSGNQNCSDGLGNCVGFGIDQLEASNGQVLHSLSLVYTNNDPSRFWFCGGFSLGSGLFYVVDRLSLGDGEICSGGLTQPQLQAFALPGTTGPYPSLPATTIPAAAGTTGGMGTTGSGTSGGGGMGPSPSGCPEYMVIDSRGSGEANGTVSPPGASFVAEFRRLHPSSRVAVLWNPYPAVGLWGSISQILNLIGAGLKISLIGAYHASVADGTKWLRTTIASEVTMCSTTRLLLTGYSQGAQVTGDVYQRDIATTLRKHIVAVALFGDPYFDPKDRAADRGKYARNKKGILGTRGAFGRGLPVLSYCRRHDPICQELESPLTLKKYGLKPHGNYPPDAISAADHFSF